MPLVTLALSGGPGFPGGSPDRRYEMQVALTPAGLLDQQGWYADPNPWPARRIWPEEPVRQGEVIFDPDSGWSLRFGSDAPDHALIRQAQRVRPGDYLTIREPDGREFSYRVVGVG